MRGVEPANCPFKNGLTQIILFLEISTDFSHTLLYPTAFPGTTATDRDVRIFFRSAVNI
jgi:hypothetical protein